MRHSFFHELAEEAEDFFDDIGEDLFRIPRRKPRKERKVNIGGLETTVRPAYIFAERIDNALKLLFASSIIISGVTASFVGFVKLSDLLEVLIFSGWGRVAMVLIGLCYFLTAAWKLAEIKVEGGGAIDD